MESSSQNGKRQHEQSDSENEDNDTKPIPNAHYQIPTKVARREETGVDEIQAALLNTSSFCDEDLKWYSIFNFCLSPEILVLLYKPPTPAFSTKDSLFLRNRGR